MPRNRIIVRVTDAANSRPIPRATVAVNASWTDQADQRTNVVQPYVTDDSGVAIVPPLHPGRVNIRVTAPRYLPAEMDSFDIASTGERELTIALEPARSANLQLLLPDGTPAAHSEACLTASGVTLWSGEAGPDGRVEVPLDWREAALVVRHSRAASSAIPVSSLPESLWLRAPASMPLIVRTQSSSQDPIRFAFLAIWIDRVRLVGPAAAFATWSPIAATGVDASWTGKNLPGASVRVLATRHVSPEQMATGAFDRLAVTVPYPWQPAGVALTPIEQ